MIGGADENDAAEDVRPSTTPPSPPSPPPSSPARPTSLGRRLLGSIRALASHPAPPPAAAVPVAAPKVGLALLLHLRPDQYHPRLHPAPSASLSPFASASDGGAAAARPHAWSHSPDSLLGHAAATSAPANSVFRQWTARRAPHLPQHLRPAADVAVGEDQASGLALVDGHGQGDRFRASDESGVSEEENLVGDKDKVGEQQGAVHGQGAALVKDVDAAGDDREEKVPTGDQLRVARDGDRELRDGATCCGIVAGDDREKVEGHATGELGSAENGDDEDAVEDQEAVEPGVVGREGEGAAVDDQEKAVQQCDTRELGTIENDGDDAEDNGQEAAEQGVIDTAMDNDNAVKDHEVVGQSVIAGIEMHATIDVQDQHKGVDATVLSSEAVSVNSSDRGVGKKEKVKLPFPQRPGKLNCPSYMSKGSCSYGFSCPLHHPPLKAKPYVSWCPSEQGNHGVADILELNRIGPPIRESKKLHLLYEGWCFSESRYGKRCHFNHPEYAIDAQFHAPTGWEDSTLELEKSSDHITTLDHTSHLKSSSHDATLDDTSYSKKSSDHATLDDTSSNSEVLQPNILRMLLPPQKVLPGTEEMVMHVKKDSNWSSTSDDSDSCCSADSSDGPLCKQEHVDSSDGPLCKQEHVDSSDGPLCKQEHVDYPEKPCRPECPFYKRFGDCKFASACNCHHPKDKYPARYHPEIPSLGGEQTEYPERPGEPECPFYMKNRSCRFMEKCRFDHPKDSDPTTESPRNGKKYVATDEHHQSTRITLDDHLPQQQQYPERPGQPDCRYYLQYGKCKFLTACIFHHPRDGLPVGWNPSGPAYSDQIGPQIHGMPECPFYMKSGKCQFGSACEFRHPKVHVQLQRAHLVTELTWQMIISEGQRMLCRNKNRLCILKGLVNHGVSTT